MTGSAPKRSSRRAIRTSSALERRGKTLDGWSRTLAVTAEGITLTHEHGRLAFFRETGRFAWSDVPKLVEREARIMDKYLYEESERMLAACERTGRLSSFLDGYIEPFIGNMSGEHDAHPLEPQLTRDR
jgi:hypothetical protein